MNILPVCLEGSHQVDENTPEHFSDWVSSSTSWPYFAKIGVADIELWNEGREILSDVKGLELAAKRRLPDPEKVRCLERFAIRQLESRNDQGSFHFG